MKVFMKENREASVFEAVYRQWHKNTNDDARRAAKAVF